MRKLGITLAVISALLLVAKIVMILIAIWAVPLGISEIITERLINTAFFLAFLNLVLVGPSALFLIGESTYR